MYFSRMTLTDPYAATSLLEQGTYGHHQQVWRFFEHEPDADRDFLYRFDLTREGAQYHIVSERQALEEVPGWRIESRPYAPDLSAGTRLRFSLRANPTKRVAKPGERSDGRRHDIVMDRKRVLVAAGQRPHMASLVQDAGTEWLSGQGERHGFELVDGTIRADGYRSHRFTRPSGASEMSVTGIDYEGILRVTDGEQFTNALQRGIGPAKGFGFGLLLVRRP